MNDRLVDTTPDFDNFVTPHTKCFGTFDIENDIIELRNDGIDAVSIYVDSIHDGNTTRLLFGQNRNISKLVIDGHSPKCNEDGEIATLIRIKNGSIYESTCISKLN